MCTRSLEQFAGSAEELLAANAASIGVDRVAFRFLVRPRLRAAIRFSDVGADSQHLQITYGGATVITLVGNHLVDHRNRIIGDVGHGFDLLGGKRLVNRRRVAGV
jgi:hypothetical protein